MKLLLLFGLGIVYCLIIGSLGYVLTISIVPEKFKDKFFSIISFFPKMPYSIILYIISGILYSIAVYFLDVNEQAIRYLIVIVSVIASSLFITLIAKLRKDNLEETYEEEIERKRNL